MKKLVARLIEQEEIEDEYLDVEDELLHYESNGQDTQTDAVNHNGRDEAEELQAEIAEIESFIQQAQSLTTDTKAEALLTALDLGFAKMANTMVREKPLYLPNPSVLSSFFVRLSLKSWPLSRQNRHLQRHKYRR